MKYIFLFLVLLTAPVTLHAAELKVAIVDTDIIMNDSKAAKSLKSQLEAKRKSFQEEFLNTEKKLKEKEAALVKERKDLSQEDLRKKVMSFRDELDVAQKKLEVKKGKIDKAFSSSYTEIKRTVRKIIQKKAQEKNLSMVLAKDILLYTDGQVDLTADVLKELDATLPSVKVSIEE